MCVSCGCQKPNDDHGDKRHITMSQLEEAAKAAGITLDQVGDNIADGTTVDEGESKD